MAAGLASATAALLTSRFGVAGTIIGAAVTTMIITGGSVILKAYLESVTGKVRRMPDKVRERASRTKEPGDLNGPNLPGRPDLRNNFMGRLRAALNWFSDLPLPRKRYILSAALIPMAFAFFIGMGTITGVELASGKSLSCGVWSKCPVSADGTEVGTRLSVQGGGTKNDGVDGTQDPQQAVDPAQEQQIPSESGAQPAQPVTPQDNVPSDPAAPAAPTPEEPSSQQPVPQEPAVQEPPQEQTPSEPSASETPVPEVPSDEAAPEPTPSTPSEP